MAGKNKLTLRTWSTRAEIRVFESDIIDPPGFYISIRAHLLEAVRMLWADDASEGKETIEPGALSAHLNNNYFKINICSDGGPIPLTQIGKANRAVCTLNPESLMIVFAAPKTQNGKMAADLINCGLIRGCSIDYKVDYSNSASVRIRRTKAPGKTILTYRVREIAQLVGITINTKTERLNPEPLRTLFEEKRPFYRLKIYGLEHCDRVARYGQQLFEPGANPDIIAAFAYLHDIERTDDYEDPGHGHRAAQFIDSIRPRYLANFSDVEIDLLKEACRQHETGTKTGNKTIDICLDADRLDLPRLGISPTPRQMVTRQGKELAKLLADGRHKAT